MDSMNIAKRINNRLDHILELRAEMRKVDSEIDDDQILDNVTTGEKTNKEGVFELIEAQINEIKNELNQITNNGLNIKDIFTNKYYVNDSMQDREIVAEINTKKNEEKINNIIKDINADLKSIVEMQKKYKDAKKEYPYFVLPMSYYHCVEIETDMKSWIKTLKEFLIWTQDSINKRYL